MIFWGAFCWMPQAAFNILKHFFVLFFYLQLLGVIFIVLPFSQKGVSVLDK